MPLAPGDPAKRKTMRDICWAACNNLPPGFTHPFGIYLCVVDIDCATGETRARRSCALDDRGTRMSPMIMAVQIRGGLTEGFEVAMGRQMPFEAEGNLLGNTPMDCVLPPFVEAPKWETDHTVTPSLHRPIGALRPSRP